MCKKDCKGKDYDYKSNIYASQVIYQGDISEDSLLNPSCELTVEEVIEDLYSRNGGGTNYYSAGPGINLEGNTFSANFGNTYDTVMRGSWRPRWEDIINAPNVPEPVQILAGDGIEVLGSFPIYTLQLSESEYGNISGISINNEIVEPNQNNISNIPTASSNRLGVVKVGSGLQIENDGTLRVTSAPTQVGNGVLSITTPLGLTATGNFSANQTNNSSIALSYEAGYRGYTIAEANKLAGLSNYTLPIATSFQLGGIKVGNNLSINSEGVLSANIPDVSYNGSTSIILSGNSFQRAALTGDVTSAQNSNTLSIANGVVSNAKLSQMPGNTFKGNSLSINGSPQDLGPEDVKDILRVGSQFQLATVFPYTATIGNESQISIFAKLDEEGTDHIMNIPNGTVDGQRLFIEFNFYITDARYFVTLNGNFINFIPGGEETSLTQITEANHRRIIAVWSEANQVWYVRIIKAVA